MNELALFAGGGGGLLAGQLLGWSTRVAVELDPYARRILLARQRDGHLPSFPIWDDVRTFSGKPWRGSVDVISGGFPCQDISAAGKGRGLTGSRSGLWFEMLRIIEEAQPQFVFAENSPNLRTRGLGTVIQGLTGLGYDVRWCVLGARHLNAPHRRDRMWILATYPDSIKLRIESGRGSWESRKEEILPSSDGQNGQMADSICYRLEGLKQAGTTQRADHRSSYGSHPGWWEAEPGLGRVVDGVAVSRVDRLKALGNGQVPAVAAAAWRMLRGGEP